MDTKTPFRRCINCFAPQEESGACFHCGYENGLGDLPGWWLVPGTVLKGRYITGCSRNSGSSELRYLGWDLQMEHPVEIMEFFPRGSVTRDITYADEVVTVPGHEEEVERGRQAFFEKAKLFYQCAGRVEPDLQMDFFLRNNTCYYTLRRGTGTRE